MACDRGRVPSGSQPGLSTVAGVRARPAPVDSGLGAELGIGQAAGSGSHSQPGEEMRFRRQGCSPPCGMLWWRCSLAEGTPGVLLWGGRDPSCHRGICAVPPAASGPCDASASRTPTHAQLVLSVQGVLALLTRSLCIWIVRFCCRF